MTTIEVYKKKDAKKQFEFFENNALLGDINFPKRFSKSALISYKNKSWKIARTGFWKHILEISADQSPYTKWNAKQSWGGCLTLRTDDNRSFKFKRTSFWKSKWSWLNEKGEPVIECKACGWPDKRKATITILDKKDDAMIWLSIVGFFLVLCAQEDAAMAAAA